jgi:hypothetical protein
VKEMWRLNKLKLVSVGLTACFAISLMLNVYFLHELSRVNNELVFYRSLSGKKISVGDIGVYWNQWNILPQQNSGIYCAVANFEIVNYREVSAYVIVAVEVRHEGQVLYEWFETGEGRRIAEPVIRYGYYIIPPAGAKNCSLIFSFLNPENLDTYLFISVVDAFPIS